jgi:hypothetical protein
VADHEGESINGKGLQMCTQGVSNCVLWHIFFLDGPEKLRNMDVKIKRSIIANFTEVNAYL